MKFGTHFFNFLAFGDHLGKKKFLKFLFDHNIRRNKQIMITDLTEFTFKRSSLINSTLLCTSFQYCKRIKLFGNGSSYNHEINIL